MVAPTRTRLVKIGKSKGVRIPQKMLDDAGFETEVELIVEGGRIVIRAVHRPRQGWAESFRKESMRGKYRGMMSSSDELASRKENGN